jgi:hypothetical protein
LYINFGIVTASIENYINCSSRKAYIWELLLLTKSCGGDAMARQGDAYPDPRKRHSGISRTKMLVCIGLLIICLSLFVAMVAAPDPFPDPNSIPGPIFIKYFGGSALPIGNFTLGNLSFFIVG